MEYPITYSSRPKYSTPELIHSDPTSFITMNQIQLEPDAWMDHLLVSISRLELLPLKLLSFSKAVVAVMVIIKIRFFPAAMIDPSLNLAPL